MTLDDYFKLIVKPTETQKETTMLEKIKLYFTQWLERCAEKINSLLTKPTTFAIVDPKTVEEDYWAFEMYTGEWYSDDRDELMPVKHTLIIEPHDCTWMQVLDRVAEELEKHYGYPIKEQIYYSVQYPLNDTDYEGNELAGYGRCLNDSLLQQVLLAFPELYESNHFASPETDLFK